MKNFKYILIAFITLGIWGCTDDDRDTKFVDAIAAPTELMAQFAITQDNSGLVTITPTATGATEFQVFFGDVEDNVQELAVGDRAQNIYEEGVYDVRVVASGLNGLTSEITQQLTVSFLAPENLMVSITRVVGDVFSINVSATADLEANFEFYSGEDPDETPISFMEGETIMYTYPAVGDYDVRVVALSGGAETTEYTETVSITNPLLLPINFEDATLNYEFVDFGSVTSTVVANPDMSGINTSSTVGQSLKPTGAEVWGGSFLQLDDPIDFSSLNNLKVNVWSPVSGITVKMKLENATDPGIAVEVDVTNTVDNAWETLTFDFSTMDLTQDYHKVVLFFDFGNPGNDNIYYFDDIDLTVSSADTYELLEDFEGTVPAFTVFGDIGATEVVANPMADPINGTVNTAQLTKSVGAQVWGGTFFELTDQVIEFAGVKKIRLKSYSPTVGSVIKVKIENADASITHEVDVNTTVTNAWETLTYDFVDAPNAQYVRVVVFYDFGNVGDGSVYYFDEIEVGEGAIVSTIPPLPIEDFEGAPPTFTVFGNIDDTQVVANPNATGLNTTATVAEQLKTNASEVWAGNFFEVTTPLDFTTYSKVRVLTHAPISGITIKLKLENADASTTHEVDITNAVANNWEELVYDFSGAPAADYVRIVLFFDFGTAGDDSLYYFDEIELTN